VPLVLDASIAASWHFGEGDAGADAVLDSLAEDSARVPMIWWFEIRNVVVFGERGGRATKEQTTAFLRLLSRLPINLADIPDGERVIDLSRKHRLTFYDASYLELAQREALGLATLDKELVKAARLEGVPLVIRTP
jgi:predicted nucleic acid-binding protein